MDPAPVSGCSESEKPLTSGAPGRWRAALRWGLALLTFTFVAVAAGGLWERWDTSRVTLSVWPLVGAFPPLLAAGFLLAFAWAILVRHLAGRHVELGAALALHAESQLARYMPGKVGIPLVRLAGAPALGVTAMAVVASIAVESLSFVSVGCGTGLGLLVATNHALLARSALIGHTGLAALAGIGVAILLLVTVDRTRWPLWALRKLRAESGGGPLVPWQMLGVHLLHAMMWAVHGYAISLAMGASGSSAWSASGLFVLAPVLGALAVVVPAGVGVREAIVSLGLAPSVGPAAALAAAIVSRALSLTADLVFWLVMRLWHSWWKKSKDRRIALH
ncbi:hypothetical protein ACFL5O_09985 [Myxococcota bacterium]